MVHFLFKSVPMKKILFAFAVLPVFLIQSSCTDDEDVIPQDLASCNPTTQYYGKVILGNELLCWSDTSLVEVSSAGSGACGNGYEYREDPFMTLGVYMREMDTISGRYRSKREIVISVPFACDDFSTKEKFFGLLSPENYSFSYLNQEFGKFVVEYTPAGGQTYSSLNVDNSQFAVKLVEVNKIGAHSDWSRNGNNCYPESFEIKMTFSCVLANSNGHKVTIKDAEVFGRTFRQSPWGYYWDDWCQE